MDYFSNNKDSKSSNSHNNDDNVGLFSNKLERIRQELKEMQVDRDHLKEELQVREERCQKTIDEAKELVQRQMAQQEKIGEFLVSCQNQNEQLEKLLVEYKKLDELYPNEPPRFDNF